MREICVLDEQGRARFEMIQPRISVKGEAVARLAEETPATLFLFDVLYVDGYDVRGVAARRAEASAECVGDSERAHQDLGGF